MNLLKSLVVIEVGEVKHPQGLSFEEGHFPQTIDNPSGGFQVSENVSSKTANRLIAQISRIQSYLISHIGIKSTFHLLPPVCAFVCRLVIYTIMITSEIHQNVWKMQTDGYSHSYIIKLLGISRYAIRNIIADPDGAKVNSSKKFRIEDLMTAIKQSVSLLEVLEKLKINPSGNNFRILKREIRENNLDTRHFLGKGHKKTISKAILANTIPIENILIENSTYQTSKLSKRLRKEKLLEYQCLHCGMGDIWNGKSITLHLDHINGVNNDHRIENLCFLCPNCHSQTSTYCGRNAKKGMTRAKIKQQRKK